LGFVPPPALLALNPRVQVLHTAPLRAGRPLATELSTTTPATELPSESELVAASTIAEETGELVKGAFAPTFETFRSLAAVAVCSALCTAIAVLLAGLEGAVAGGFKLIYAGAIAGIISRTCCAPLEMVSTVMMCRGDECKSMWSELAVAYRSAGVGGLFKGNGANCLKVAPSRGTQFLVYEFMKRQMSARGIGMAALGMPLNAGARLFAGGIAGMVAAVIVYPLEVVKTLRTVYPDQCKGIKDAAAMAFKFGGISGLYAGVMPTLVAMFPYVGVEFMVYETLKRRWELLIGGVAGTGALLLLGAIAGAAAQACAHPLDVVRRRMQMQGMQGNFASSGAAKVPPRYSNLFSGLYRITKDEGFHVLFKGLGPACFEKVPSTAIGYYIYEAMKTFMRVASV